MFLKAVCRVKRVAMIIGGNAYGKPGSKGERDIVLARGASRVMIDAMMKRGDQYFLWVCKRCGNIAIHNPETKRKWCKACNTREIAPVQIPYVTKSLHQILGAMGIAFRFLTEPNN